ncbi:hypothetical protein [Phaeodactylibacter luteus]|uniref:Uncharacterized protein n=1 Tax=Phaeodactylibacter luteus TaxID=1564516 RepID=A0A5C6RZQ1_9BACT|nr:hypothetical protein [Phaeodactylibacter luteus]TXB67577.1 hypothetical protein FRY97_04070 [Phaeodactylibacter luteus]
MNTNAFAMLFILWGLSPALFAQTAFSEEPRPMSQGAEPSFLLDFRIGQAEDIADLWADYQKGFKAKKPKLNKETGEYLTDNARIETISNNTIDIYATISPKGEAMGAVVTVWFNLGGAYLSSERHPDRMPGAYAWLEGFRNKVMYEYAEEVLDNQEDLLKELEKGLSDLKKEEEKAKENVADLEAELAEAKKAAQAAAQAVAGKKAEVSKQEQQVQLAKEKVNSIKKKQ